MPPMTPAQALNEGRPEARTVPTDRALVSQELILFENAGSDDLQDVVDTTFETGRITLRLPLGDPPHAAGVRMLQALVDRSALSRQAQRSLAVSTLRGGCVP